mgnify:CR=1 FL=1
MDAAELTRKARTADELWAAWEQVVTEAGRTDGHERLVAFVVAVRDSGHTESEGFDGLVRDWSELPVFGAVMREAWNRQDTPEGILAWCRLNAFAARLTEAGVDFLLYGLWTLREVFEEHDDVPAALLPAVDPWFRFCGARIRRACAEELDPGFAWLGPAALEAGLTQPAFTPERWRFWKSRRP